MHLHRHQDAVIWQEVTYSYAWIIDQITVWEVWLTNELICAGEVVLLEADYSPSGIAALLALWRLGAIVIPFSQLNNPIREEYLSIAAPQHIVKIDEQQTRTHAIKSATSENALYQQLRHNCHPGLVLFTSGISGNPKGAVHDTYKLLAKGARIVAKHERILAFLTLDHLGGFDTLLYCLYNCGCLVIPSLRTPDGILEAIEKHQVTLLPTSPSFLNLVLLSGAYERHLLSSLRKISYGAEPMPQTTLKRFHQIYPHIKLTQTYATTELGVLRTASESSDSLWMRMGGEEHQIRVRNGILEVYSPNMMLGYLNASTPLTEDGWYITGDIVEESEALLRIKGRASDVINVGGEKVNPLDVENVIRQMSEVADVMAYGEANAILGQIVAVKVLPANRESKIDLPSAIRHYCLKRLPKFMVPVRVIVSYDMLPTIRHKRTRRS